MQLPVHTVLAAGRGGEEWRGEEDKKTALSAEIVIALPLESCESYGGCLSWDSI